MLPALSTTTEPCVGPRADLPSGRSPQPGTVSNVMAPQPMRTDLAGSAEWTGSVESAIETIPIDKQLFMMWTPGCYAKGEIQSIRTDISIMSLAVQFNPRGR